ncbi:MAG: DUF4238 domain-containing protein [gamma proteobacterium symbiont of Taylorina sp.]|nr:DUF4238 domain-containing protein [gamma proteobacterium symbiont of Taylorina sp.]
MESIIPKKHHYVPQFILRNFSIGKKKRIFVLDKRNLKVFTSHTKDIAHENHFYKDDEFGFEVDTETKLADLESECAPIFSRIISEESIKNINEFDRALICLFTTVQLTRTNNTREFLASMNKAIADWARKSGIDPNIDIENFYEQTEKEIKESSIKILRSVPGDTAKHLLDKEMVLVKSPKREPFYISDHPVVMYNHYPRQGRGNLGIGLKGIEIHFPISPRLCLMFICGETIEEIRSKVSEHNIRIRLGTAFPVDMSEPEEYVEDLNCKKTRLLKPENVEFHNSLQVIQSSRFIYSGNKEFELAKDMLDTEPELRFPAELEQNEIAF